jgi:hypothetical protein
VKDIIRQDDKSLNILIFKERKVKIFVIDVIVE